MCGVDVSPVVHAGSVCPTLGKGYPEPLEGRRVLHG